MAPQMMNDSETTWPTCTWEPDEALTVRSNAASLPAYYEEAPGLTSVGTSWGDWGTSLDDTTSWYDGADASADAYNPPAALALLDSTAQLGLHAAPERMCVNEKLHSTLGAGPAQREHLDFDVETEEDSDSGSIDENVTCPNCGESKRSKGTWCRSAACKSRREALAKGGAVTSLQRADSQTVFQYDEPSYSTPPSFEDIAEWTQPGAPIHQLLHLPNTTEPTAETLDFTSAAAVHVPSQRQQPLPEQHVQPQLQQAAAPPPAPAARTPELPANASPRKRFYAEVSQLQEDAGTPFVKVPTVGMKTLDLFTLYQEVSTRGGMHEVAKKKLWKSIAQTLKLPTTCTDYGFRLRRHYERYLLAYEQKHLGTLSPEQQPANSRKKRKQRSERASRRAESKEAWTTENPYSKHYTA